MNDLKFGTSGLRGLARAFDEETCQAYTQAFLQLVLERDSIDNNKILLLGQDLRPSSPLIAQAVAHGAQNFGFQIENCGQLPTPALALRALLCKIPAIMVTGSHIPKDRNGLKFYRPSGEINKFDEQAITQRVLEKGEKSKRYSKQKDQEVASTAKPYTLPPLPLLNRQAIEAYRLRAMNFLPPLALHGFKIGVYQQSCVARDLLTEILTAFGAQTVPFGREEKFLAIDTEALSENTLTLTAQAARDYQLDAIVSTDGDGDRPLIADKNGVYLRGDIIGLLCAQFLKADCVVTPVTSTSLIESCGFFSKTYRCRVGSPYVLQTIALAKNAQFKTIIGFEANGGVMLGSDVLLDEYSQHNILSALPTRDAMLPILSVLGLAAKRKMPLDKLTSGLPLRFTASGRLENVAQEESTPFLHHLAKKSSTREHFCQVFGAINAQDTIDGLRLILDRDEIIHYRASGNAPELRCYSEAGSLTRAEEIMGKGLKFASLFFPKCAIFNP